MRRAALCVWCTLCAALWPFLNETMIVIHESPARGHSVCSDLLLVRAQEKTLQSWSSMTWRSGSSGERRTAYWLCLCFTWSEMKSHGPSTLLHPDTSGVPSPFSQFPLCTVVLRHSTSPLLFHLVHISSLWFPFVSPPCPTLPSAPPCFTRISLVWRIHLFSSLA